MNKYVIAFVVLASVAVVILIVTTSLPKSGVPQIKFQVPLQDSKISQFVSAGKNVWFTNSIVDTVICFEKESGKIVKKLNNPLYNFSFPYGLAFDGVNIWVTNPRNNSITIFRENDGELVKNITENVSEPIGICYDSINKKMWVTSSNRIMYYSSLKFNEIGYIEDDNYINRPESIIFDGTRIWFINQQRFVTGINVLQIGSKNFLKLDSAEYKFEGSRNLCYDGKKIWVTNDGNNSITCFNATSGIFIKNLNDKLYFPAGITYDGKNICVSNQGDNTITFYNSETEELYLNLEVTSEDDKMTGSILYADNMIFASTAKSFIGLKI
jgi:DNA-binding beta-propeller fold protein YncE